MLLLLIITCHDLSYELIADAYRSPFIAECVSAAAEYKKCQQQMPKTKALTEGAHSLTTDGITFAYTVSGSGPLLVVQSVGWGLSSIYLQRGLRALEAHFKLLYFTPRGNGDSSRPESDSAMSIKDMAYDLEHLREHLQLSSFALLGHSNAGAIALAYAERFPIHVTKLILVNHELQTFSSNNWEVFAAARKDHPVYGPALQQLTSMYRAQMRSFPPP
jgi:proline iminopeptidase